MKQFFFIIILMIVFYSCDDNSEKKLKIMYYNISECRHECESEPNKIITNELSGDTLNLRLGIIMNCAWMEGVIVKSFNLNNDTLYLNIEKIMTDMEYACTCYFYNDIRLINIKHKPKTILVNSKDILNGNW